jgi:type II secretory ATPase GspE/PulE/Tfp pilus assembly ATPase PilB-like protein
VLTLLPTALVNQHRIVPVSFCNNRLTLAMTNPNNVVAFDDVRRVIKGVMIEPVAVSDEDFRRFIGTAYAEAIKPALSSLASAAATAPRGGKAPAKVETRSEKTAGAVTVDLLQSDMIRELQLADEQQVKAETKQDLMNASEDAPIIRIANSILGLAIKQGASDIHIEPMEEDVTVRFRIDGVLQVLQKLPKKVQLGLVSRVKILSRLDISEKRLPQDGRISVTMEGKPIDFRVSTVPGKWGEKICMRILDKSNTTLGLDKLISHPPTLALVREMINQPYGIIYVTGPTGSGKTTTLYSALAEINEPGVNISTAEDPIEYDLPGVTQIQANSDIGLTFASILRAFLRQDPDVLLVGETRDKETAHTAVEAALTGHLVFTTLHTNNAAAAFTRLNEMGIEPFLVSSSTVGVIAQRLARRLCQACQEEYEAEPDAAAHGRDRQARRGDCRRRPQRRDDRSQEVRRDSAARRIDNGGRGDERRRDRGLASPLPGHVDDVVVVQRVFPFQSHFLRGRLCRAEEGSVFGFEHLERDRSALGGIHRGNDGEEKSGVARVDRETNVERRPAGAVFDDDRRLRATERDLASLFQFLRRRLPAGRQNGCEEKNGAESGYATRRRESTE